MSSEVICLSSDDDAHASMKNPNMTHEVEKNSQKRKLPFVPATTNDDTKKQKIVKKESPQPGCSKDLPQVPFNGDAAIEKVEKLDSSQSGFSKEFDIKKIVKPQLVAKTKIPIPTEDEDVFEKFIELCSEKKNDTDTRKILQKLKKLYGKLSPSQKTNNEFRLYISNCHNSIIEGLSSGIYKIIADLHTEIKKQIISVKVSGASADNNGESDEPVQVSKEDEKKIKLLENAIKLCKKKIQELEDTDVDLNDDSENSAYIMEDKYKKRLIQLCKELSKLNGDKDMKKQISKAKIKAKDIRDEMTGVKLFDEAILNLVNSNINEINQLKYLKNYESYAGHIRAPDYADVLNCIQKCNAANKLDLSDQKLEVLAKKAFEAVVKSLKRKRLDDTKFYFQSLAEDKCEDPAMKDENLKTKLQKNHEEGIKKLNEIFKQYDDKQKLLESSNQVDAKKQAESGSEDDSESDTENKILDENLAPKEKSYEIDDKKKLDSILFENDFLHDDEEKMETDNEPPSKDLNETVEVIADKDNDTIVVLNDDNGSNDRNATVHTIGQ